MTLVLAALGGAIGAALRYLAAVTMAFPFATITVNVVGSFLMGLAFVWFGRAGMEHWQALLMTGALGGFTTYSAFSLDALRLIEGGEILAASAYIFGTVSLCIGAVFVGVWMGRAL